MFDSSIPRPVDRQFSSRLRPPASVTAAHRPAVGVEIPAVLPIQSAASKVTYWPRPEYSQLVAEGHSPVAVRIFRFIYESVPQKPADNVRRSEFYFGEAVARVRSQAMAWLRDVTASGTKSFLSRESVCCALSSVYARCWGPCHTDQGYLLRRKQSDQFGSEIRALFGLTSAPVRPPTPANLAQGAFDLERGWPAHRPKWEFDRIFVLPKDAISVESRGLATTARWSASRCRDRGTLSAFTCHADAQEWFDALPLFVVLTDRERTRILSTHDTRELADTYAASLGKPST
jgi:hypothetical protein